MGPTLRCEIFQGGRTATGVLLRQRIDTGLATLMCLRAPDGALVQVESRVTFDADVFGWTRYTYSEHGGASVDVRREDVEDDDPRLIPSYAEYLLLADVGAGRGMAVAYRRLHDAAPHAPAPAAVARPGDQEDVALLGGEVRRCARVDVLESEAVVGSHWFYGNTMVASDWRGARTFLVPDLATALDAVDADVRATARSWPPQS